MIGVAGVSITTFTVAIAIGLVLLAARYAATHPRRFLLWVCVFCGVALAIHQSVDGRAATVQHEETR